MRSTIRAVLAALLLAATTSAAAACNRSMPAEARNTVVPAQGIDQRLLNRAVRAEVNYHRCRAGLDPLRDAGRNLAHVVEGHSTWMARSQTLSHRSTVPGRASLTQRVKATGIRFRTGAENIGMVHRYQIDNLSFRILDSQACSFATHDGRPLPAHSYGSLARHAVTLWMASPGHRKNILDRRVKMMSTAVAFDPNSQYCGRFWLTQTFIG